MIFVRRGKYRQVLPRRRFTVQFLKKPVLLRARKRSYRGRDVKLISLKYRGREGFAVITGCSVNTRIKCARCNADRQVGKAARLSYTRFSKLALLPLRAPVSSLSLCLLPFPFFFRSLSRSCHGGESHFRATEFLRDDRGEPGTACIQIRGT